MGRKKFVDLALLIIGIITLLALVGCQPAAQAIESATAAPSASTTPISVESVTLLSQQSTDVPTSSPIPEVSVTASNTPAPTATETPYPYEGSYPGMGKQLLAAWERWRQTVSGPFVEDIPDGTLMQTESHPAGVLLLHKALRRGMVPDFTGIDRGISLVCYSPAVGTIVMTPDMMAELEKQNVVLWFGAGGTANNSTGQFYQTESQMVGITEEPDESVQSVLFGGSKKDLLSNLEHMGTFDLFHESADPQTVTIDMSKINAIHIIPLSKESIRTFLKRNGITQNGPHSSLWTGVNAPTIIRGTVSMSKFFSQP